MNNEQINKILQNLESGYDRMANKFSETRKFFWRDLEFLSDYVQNGDKILDYGCGNGRLWEILKDKNIDYYGVDVSQRLVEAAKEKYPEFAEKFQKISFQDSLPFSDNNFNKVISIAVFHHFPPEYAQEKAEDLHRVLKPGGEVIITAWNLRQEMFRKYAEKEGQKDIYIPFKDNAGNVFNRYHRIYEERELSRVFQEAGFWERRLEIVFGKNILYVGKK